MQKKCYDEISACRSCGSANLEHVFSLGEQYLTGVFPKSKDEIVGKGPLDLVLCKECGLLQLKQSYCLSDMYGMNYGYRSGLNPSMVDHLQRKIHKLEKLVHLKNEDMVVDVGSNDATSLKAYTTPCKRIGIDPTAIKFKQYYTKDISYIPDFFSKEIFNETFPEKKARILTSMSMFYDLEQPRRFARDVEAVLEDDGIWHFEQSYMPSMIAAGSYDTICHEHLEFYSLSVIKDILDNAHMRIMDVELNDINGGSFAITACKKNAPYVTNKSIVDHLLSEEMRLGFSTTAPFKLFAEKAKENSMRIRELLDSIGKENKVLGYGASTKGNVLLQYCQIGIKQISHIVEVNEDKFGAYTPGTNIPIISETEGKKMQPSYYFVLPWHFRDMILRKEQSFLEHGGKFIFPLPHLEIVGSNGIERIE